MQPIYKNNLQETKSSAVTSIYRYNTNHPAVVIGTLLDYSLDKKKTQKTPKTKNETTADKDPGLQLYIYWDFFQIYNELMNLIG